MNLRIQQWVTRDYRLQLMQVFKTMSAIWSSLTMEVTTSWIFMWMVQGSSYGPSLGDPWIVLILHPLLWFIARPTDNKWE